MADYHKEYYKINKEKNKKEHSGSWGNIKVCTRKSWKYTPRVKELMDDVAIQKDMEQRKGLALVEESEYLTYKPNE
jgi:hypothetical protein